MIRNAPLFHFSIGLKNHTRIKFNSTIHFYDVGIGGRDEEKGQNAKHPNWMLRKFTTLYKALDPTVNDIQVSNRPKGLYHKIQIRHG